MAELTTLARLYAKGGFQHQSPAQQLTPGLPCWVWLRRSPDNTMQRCLKAPQLTNEQKGQAPDGRVGEELIRQHATLFRAGGKQVVWSLLPRLPCCLSSTRLNRKIEVDVEVTSAFALNADQQDQLAKALSARLPSREVRLQTREDASLIGGVVIRAGDLVIDGSGTGKIAQLAEALKSRV